MGCEGVLPFYVHPGYLPHLRGRKLRRGESAFGFLGTFAALLLYLVYNSGVIVDFS